MAEFVEVMKQRNRMCDTYRDCEGCLLDSEHSGANMLCGVFTANKPKEAEAIIMKWAAENTIKTNADKFKEVFGAEINKAALGCVGIKTDCSYPCTNCKYHNFWDKEYVEP